MGEYVYDGDGRRLQKTENNETTTYIYSGLSVLCEETMTGTACYIYGPAGRLAKRTTINGESNMFYYHTDHLGSTRLVTDSNRNIVSAISYHPFGEPSLKEGSEDYLFCGKEKNETGLYYYGARYYDPDLGRFLTRDPYSGKLVKPQSLNQYTYCYNNPLLFVDPDGRDPLHYEGPIYYGEEEKTLVYSHAPQLMGYVNCREGYEWFAYFCIVSGIILSIASAPNLLPLLGGHLVSFAKAMAAAGPRVASAIFGALKLALKSIGTWWGHLPHKKRLAIIAAILGALLEITRSIVDHWKKVNEPLDEETGSVIYRGGIPIGTKTIVEEGPGYEVGMVMLLNDLYDDSDDVTYQYRFYQGVFWVWSDEEQDWVQQPPGWEPGDEPQLP